MAGQRFEFLSQVGGSTADTVALVIAAFAILVAALGVVFVGRVQARRLREESGHAEQVFTRVHRDPGNDEIRLSARRRVRIDADPQATRTDGIPAISQTALQEAEIYLQHHRMALKHHSAYQQASLWSGLLGFSVVLVGGVLTYLAGLDVGGVTALAGVIPATAGRLLFRQANIVGERAAENLRGLEDSVRRLNALQGALAATAEIGDRQTRNHMYELIGTHMLFPTDKLETLLKKRVKAVENGKKKRDS